MDIAQYFAQKLLFDRHPTVLPARCINKRQKKKHCALCRTMCPVQALNEVDEPDFSLCDDCGICVAHCPAGAICGCSAYQSKLIGLLNPPRAHTVLGCDKAEASADCSLACLAAYPYALIASLALAGSTISFARGKCEGCEYEPYMPLFDRSLARVREVLGEARYAELLQKEGKERLPQTRREALGSLLKSSGRTAVTVLPKFAEQDEQGGLWPRVLSHYARASKSEIGRPTPIFTPDCNACGICAQLCPNEALAVLPSENRFYMVHFAAQCEGCGICEAACRFGGIEGFGLYTAGADAPRLSQTCATACTECGRPTAHESGLCFACIARKFGQ